MKLMVCGSRTIDDEIWGHEKIEETVRENTFTDVMLKIKDGNYAGAVSVLEELGKNAYKNRRNDEAALLKQIQNSNTEGQ